MPWSIAPARPAARWIPTQRRTTDFYRAVKAKDDETVCFSWIEWPDKATRDAGMAKMFEQMPDMMEAYPMPFNGKRLIYGGFETLLDDSN